MKECILVGNFQQMFTLICDTMTKIKFVYTLEIYLQRVVWVKENIVCLITFMEFKRQYFNRKNV